MGFREVPIGFSLFKGESKPASPGLSVHIGWKGLGVELSECVDDAIECTVDVILLNKAGLRLLATLSQLDKEVLTLFRVSNHSFFGFVRP